MNKYNNPEEFIHNEFITNRGYESDCILTKKEMYKMIIKNKINFKKEKPIDYIKKEELLNALLTKFSYKDLSEYVGVRNYCFMDKFDVTEEEMEYLRNKKIVHTTMIKERTNIYKTFNIKFYLYDVYDYFNLNKEYINECLIKAGLRKK